MDRRKRIRIVVVAAIGLLALFVAFVGAPLVAAALWPEPNLSEDLAALQDSFTQAERTAEAANAVSLVALSVAGICMIYLLVVVAAWSIGPSVRNTDQKV